jgi:hypothetical protein
VRLGRLPVSRWPSSPCPYRPLERCLPPRTLTGTGEFALESHFKIAECATGAVLRGTDGLLEGETVTPPPPQVVIETSTAKRRDRLRNLTLVASSILLCSSGLQSAVERESVHGMGRGLDYRTGWRATLLGLWKTAQCFGKPPLNVSETRTLVVGGAG